MNSLVTSTILCSTLVPMAAVSLGGGVIVTTLVILGLLCLLWFGIDAMGPPGALQKFIHGFLIFCAVVVLVWAVLRLTGVSLP